MRIAFNSLAEFHSLAVQLQWHLSLSNRAQAEEVLAKMAGYTSRHEVDADSIAEGDLLSAQDWAKKIADMVAAGTLPAVPPQIPASSKRLTAINRPLAAVPALKYVEARLGTLKEAYFKDLKALKQAVLQSQADAKGELSGLPKNAEDKDFISLLSLLPRPVAAVEALDALRTGMRGFPPLSAALVVLARRADVPHVKEYAIVECYSSLVQCFRLLSQSRNPTGEALAELDSYGVLILGDLPPNKAKALGVPHKLTPPLELRLNQGIRPLSY
jgi:hypothetical protein